MHTFTDATFKNDINAPLVIVDVWATWCAPCRMFGPVFEEVSNEHPEIRMGKLNVEENQQTPMQYGIRSIPTLLAFKNGELVETKSGAMSKETLIEWINTLK